MIIQRFRSGTLRIAEKSYQEVDEVTTRERLHNGSGGWGDAGWRGWLTGDVQRKSRRKSFSSKPRPAPESRILNSAECAERSMSRTLIWCLRPCRRIGPFLSPFLSFVSFVSSFLLHSPSILSLSLSLSFTRSRSHRLSQSRRGPSALK